MRNMCNFNKNKKTCHPEFISGSLTEVDSQKVKEIPKQVQHDMATQERNDVVRHCERSVAIHIQEGNEDIQELPCHPEFISGSHDEKVKEIPEHGGQSDVRNDMTTQERKGKTYETGLPRSLRSLAMTKNKKSAFTLAEVFSPHFAGCRKTAFTLAEVLITLGIIGIVAAMTLPSLLAKSQKRVIAQRLKQTYSIINQAFDMAKAEYGDSNQWAAAIPMFPNDGNAENYRDNFLNTYFLPYIIGNYKEGTAIEMGYPDWYGTLSDPNYKGVNWKTQHIKLANGTIIRTTMNNNGVDFRDILFYADVNGIKKPNAMGKDIFLIEFKFNSGKVEFHGHGTSKEDLLKHSCGKNPGGDQACGEVIMLDNWEITKDYPKW